MADHDATRRHLSALRMLFREIEASDRRARDQELEALTVATLALRILCRALGRRNRDDDGDGA